MKKYFSIIVLVLIATVILSACGGKPLAAAFDKAAVEAAAKGVVEKLNARDAQGLRDISNPQLNAAIDDATMGQILDAVAAAGAFNGFGDMAVSGVNTNNLDYAMVILKADYAQKDLIYTISFDTDMKLAGLYYK